MVIDVPSHSWRYPDHFNDDFREQAKYAKGGPDLDLTVTREGLQRLHQEGSAEFSGGGVVHSYDSPYRMISLFCAHSG